jgi:hypothetical protein
LEHRKAFEALGNKTKCPVTDDHLAGVGFSSTLKESIKAVVDRRNYNIIFG